MSSRTSKPTMFSMKTQVFNGLDEHLVSCSKDDLENIFDFFIEKYPIKLRNSRKVSILTDSKPSSKLLDFLLQHDIPIAQLHECFDKLELRSAAEYLEEKYPDEKFSSNSKTIETTQGNESRSVETTTPLTSTDKIQQQQTSPETSEMAETNKNEAFINIYEIVLPVIFEDKESYLLGGEDKTLSYPICGKFQTIYIPERKLHAKKRCFDNQYQYLNELLMIKFRHFNLITAECIYKSGQENTYYLLYDNNSFDSNSSFLLSDYARIMINIKNPNQFDVYQQLVILKDISCGLSYLHEKSEQKISQILHGNLQADSVIIEIRQNQVCAKLFNFVDSIHTTDKLEKENIKDEYYKFGLLIFLVTRWQPIDKFKCDEIHSEERYDKDTYILDLFKQFHLYTEPHKKIRHSLFCMFFYLTSPKFHLKERIIKYYGKFKKLAQQIEDDKHNISIKENLPR